MGYTIMLYWIANHLLWKLYFWFIIWC